MGYAERGRVIAHFADAGEKLKRPELISSMQGSHKSKMTDKEKVFRNGREACLVIPQECQAGGLEVHLKLSGCATAHGLRQKPVGFRRVPGALTLPNSGCRGVRRR